MSEVVLDAIYARLVIRDVSLRMFLHEQGWCVRRADAMRFTMAAAIKYLSEHPRGAYQIEDAQ